MLKIKINVMMQMNSDSLSLDCVLYIKYSFYIRQLYQSSIIQNTNGEHWGDDYGVHLDNVPVSPNHLAVVFQTYYGK